ncbi:MAG: hypothetical protein ABIU06_17005 [Anaerolineales bacterium]
MDTELLEKELQIWTRFMYMALGSSITLAVISLGNFIDGGWLGFERYVGGLWQWMQVAATLPGFYLLWSKRWRAIPFPNRKNTILGFLLASWFNFLSLGFITVNGPLVNLCFLILVGTILIAFGYFNMAKRKSDQPDEMFP